jgi:hypothetical protein
MIGEVPESTRDPVEHARQGLRQPVKADLSAILQQTFELSRLLAWRWEVGPARVDHVGRSVVPHSPLPETRFKSLFVAGMLHEEAVAGVAKAHKQWGYAEGESGTGRLPLHLAVPLS